MYLGWGSSITVTLKAPWWLQYVARRTADVVTEQGHLWIYLGYASWQAWFIAPGCLLMGLWWNMQSREWLDILVDAEAALISLQIRGWGVYGHRSPSEGWLGILNVSRPRGFGVPSHTMVMISLVKLEYSKSVGQSSPCRCKVFGWTLPAVAFLCWVLVSDCVQGRSMCSSPPHDAFFLNLCEYTVW